MYESHKFCCNAHFIEKLSQVCHHVLEPLIKPNHFLLIEFFFCRQRYTITLKERMMLVKQSVVVILFSLMASLHVQLGTDDHRFQTIIHTNRK